jgi:hypothetical protein
MLRNPSIQRLNLLLIWGKIADNFFSPVAFFHFPILLYSGGKRGMGGCRIEPRADSREKIDIPVSSVGSVDFDDLN